MARPKEDPEVKVEMVAGAIRAGSIQGGPEPSPAEVAQHLGWSLRWVQMYWPTRWHRSVKAGKRVALGRAPQDPVRVATAYTVTEADLRDLSRSLSAKGVGHRRIATALGVNSDKVRRLLGRR